MYFVTALAVQVVQHHYHRATQFPDRNIVLGSTAQVQLTAVQVSFTIGSINWLNARTIEQTLNQLNQGVKQV